ncbi:MAG TPA: GT4 family glycosyltransferase PelF [Ktedonobacteraceae bacterium]|nr:GT4 family glycosyltransferase PelF [Ktedonobacteraceae bacterium]
MADICLLVEGAYPYVLGGVSAWLHALISNLPDLTFSLLSIGTRPEHRQAALYRLPDNVVEFREVFINDARRLKKHRIAKRVSPTWDTFHTLHEAVALGKTYDSATLQPLLCESGFAGLTASDLFHGRASWKLLVRLYELYAPQMAFADFFWTFRFTYLPVFTIFETLLPQAQVYHAVSTGYSGLLGALAKIRTGRPFIITEHGLYTREREIEIAQATWMDQPASLHDISKQRMGYFQEWWLNIYRFMEKIAYDSADSIISITAINQRYQLAHGADPEKARVIPNGIDIGRLENLREQGALVADAAYSASTANGTAIPVVDIQQAALQPIPQNGASRPFLVGFVGRVVSIKDVKTFIRAIKIAQQMIPDLTSYIIGPTEEEPAYFQECRRLIELLNLEMIIHFTGSVDVRTYYSKLDVLVLTSLSEGQPLVILEGNCAGLPVIATDVGACRELLMGISPEDQALGESGIITFVASPQQTANAIIQLWRDEDLRLKMGRAGQKRVRRFYRQEQLYHAYDELYRHYMTQAFFV